MSIEEDDETFDLAVMALVIFLSLIRQRGVSEMARVVKKEWASDQLHLGHSK